MKKENKYMSTAVIDADYIIWIACNPNKVLDEQGNPTKKDGKFVYTDKTVEQAINTCDAYMNDILSLTRVDSFILCLTGKDNFRCKIDPSYKANRVGMEKPMWFSEVKEHMRTHWDAVEVPGLEADDVANIIFHSLENSFIIAADKDLLDCIPGRHFDARRGRACFVTVTDSQAEFNFAKSVLAGDAIDGIPNMKRGYGPKTAEKDILKSSEPTPLMAAQKIYVDEFGEEEGKMRFDKQVKLLKILETFEELPEGITFEFPEPSCYDCVGTTFSGEEYWLGLNEAEDD